MATPEVFVGCLLSIIENCQISTHGFTFHLSAQSWMWYKEAMKGVTYFVKWYTCTHVGWGIILDNLASYLDCDTQNLKIMLLFWIIPQTLVYSAYTYSGRLVR